MSSKARQLVVNADDFGLSPGVNRGIIEAHVNGIVTSASAMTRWPAARQAARLAGDHPNLGLGLHVDLGEWACRGDTWLPLYEVVQMNDAQAVEREIREQLAQFRRLFGRDPDHLDSHQHVHRQEPVRTILLTLGRELHAPLRHFTGPRFCGDFYGQNESGQSFPELISIDSLLRLLEHLPEGVSELSCHPAAASDLQTMYGRERITELQTLTSGQVKRAIARWNIQLGSFSMFRLENRPF